MSTDGINVSLTNKNWGVIEVTGLEYYSPEWQYGPEPFRDKVGRLGHGESKRYHLEAYTTTHHDGYRFTLTIKVDDAWTIKVTVDPITWYDEVYTKLKHTSKVCGVTVVDGDRSAPPSVYALFSGQGSDHNMEIVVARQHDGILVDSGELARSPKEQEKYQAWLAGLPAGYYDHDSFNGVPLAKDPPDDRKEGAVSYTDLRNVDGGQFARLIADTALWKSGASDTFFHALPTPKGADHRLYADDEWFGCVFRPS